MKPPERFPPDDPREWLNRARSNMAKAKNRVPDAYLEDRASMRNRPQRKPTRR